MKRSLLLLSIVLMALTASEATATVKLPQLFQDGMVLQRGADIPIWGWADAGDEISIEMLNDKGKVVSAATAVTSFGG